MNRSHAVIALAITAGVVFLLPVASGQCEDCTFFEDATGNENPMETNTSVTESTESVEKYGKGATEFEDRSDNLLSNASSLVPFQAREFTWFVALNWTMCDNLGCSSQPIRWVTDETAQRSVYLLDGSSDRWNFRVEDCDGNHVNAAAVGDDLPDSMFHGNHVVRFTLTYEESGNDAIVKVYDNATLHDTYTFTDHQACFDESSSYWDRAPGFGLAALPGGDEAVYEARIWHKVLEESEIEALSDPSDPTYEHELRGDEVGAWFFEAGIDVGPIPTGPEPVDFADGIQDAAAGWGFRTNESQMFFALAVMGIATVATGTGLKVMSSGRTKNLMLAGVGFLVGIFFVLVRMLEFWMFTVAAILAGFALLGGPREVANTWAEATQAARRLTQDEADVLEGEEPPPPPGGPGPAPEFRRETVESLESIPGAPERPKIREAEDGFDLSPRI